VQIEVQVAHSASFSSQVGRKFFITVGQGWEFWLPLTFPWLRGSGVPQYCLPHGLHGEGQFLLGSGERPDFTRPLPIPTYRREGEGHLVTSR